MASAQDPFTCEIKEEIGYKLDLNDKPSVTKRKGVFNIRNNSKQIAVAHLSMKLANYLGKAKTQSIDFTLVKPGKHFVWQYKDFKPEPLAVQVEDIISAEYFDAESNELLFDTDHQFRMLFSISNEYSEDLYNVKYYRELDPDYSVALGKISTGNVEMRTSNLLVWTINHLPAKTSAQVEVIFTINLETPSTRVLMGRSKLECVLPTLISGMTIADFTANSGCEITIQVSEDEETSQLWSCHAEVKNISDFELYLERIEILTAEIPPQICYEFSDKEDPIALRPADVWQSPAWEIESDTPPFFQKRVKTSIIPTVSFLSQIQLKKDGFYLNNNIEYE